MSRQVDATIAALERETATAAKALVLEIDKNLRKTTPVDTGHARASWIPSVGSPSTVEPAGTDGSAHDAGVRDVLAAQIGDALYTSNNTPYIQQLNLGHSAQAPVGFIEAAIDQAQQTVAAKYSGRVLIDVGSAISAQGAANLAEYYDPTGGGE